MTITLPADHILPMPEGFPYDCDRCNGRGEIAVTGYWADIYGEGDAECDECDGTGQDVTPWRDIRTPELQRLAGVVAPESPEGISIAMLLQTRAEMAEGDTYGNPYDIHPIDG